MGGITGVSGQGYRWYLAAQVVSLAGTMMGYTALFWLVLHIRHGGAPALAAVDAALSLPMLLFSRRAGTIVLRYRAVRVAMVTQALLAAASLAIGVPLLAGWMTLWYLVPLSFATGCVQCVDLPARQTLMLDLVGPGELRRGTSLFATVTGLAKIAGPGVAGIVIATTGETAVFFVDAVSFLGVVAVLTWLSRTLVPAAWAYDAAMVVLGAATQLFAVSATVYVQQATPPAQRGHALSAYNAGFIGFVPAGAFLVAAIASAAGTRWALAGPGLAIAACAAAMLLNPTAGSYTDSP